MQDRRFWALDSTSITSYSENIASVAYGKNKDLISAPQTNVLFLVDQETGIPLYLALRGYVWVESIHQIPSGRLGNGMRILEQIS